MSVGANVPDPGSVGPARPFWVDTEQAADLAVHSVGVSTPLPLVRAAHEGAVATVTLDSPPNRNALSRRLVSELDAALGAAGEDPAVRVVVLTGTGSTFCAGADLQERLAGPAPPDGDGATVPTVIDRIASMRKPVVCKVNGHVRAGGMGLVAACDVAVAPSSATFAFSEVRVGVAPAIIIVPALRVMAPRALARYVLSGQMFDAAEAVASGLLTAAPGAAELDEWVAGQIAELLRASPDGVAAAKELLGELRLRPWGPALEEAARRSDQLFATPAAAEGMAAFLEKRPPSWVDDRR